MSMKKYHVSRWDNPNIFVIIGAENSTDAVRKVLELAHSDLQVLTVHVNDNGYNIVDVQNGHKYIVSNGEAFLNM